MPAPWFAGKQLVKVKVKKSRDIKHVYHTVPDGSLGKTSVSGPCSVLFMIQKLWVRTLMVLNMGYSVLSCLDILNRSENILSDLFRYRF